MLDIRPQLKKKEHVFIKWDGNIIMMNPHTRTTTLFTPEGESEFLANDSTILADALLGGTLATEAEAQAAIKKSTEHARENTATPEPFHPDDLKD